MIVHWSTRSGMPVLVSALLTAGLLGSAGQGAAPPSGVADLDLIPTDARGFVSVRLADVWKSPAVKKKLAAAKKLEDPAARMEKEFGLRPAEVERVSFVYSAERAGWAVVRTAEPYDADKILARLKGVKKGTHRGRTYHAGKDRHGNEAAVWLAGPRVIVAGPAAGVRRCIELALAGPADGPLREIIELGKDEEHHVLAGLDGDKVGTRKDNLVLSWLTPVRLAWGTVDLVDEEAVVMLRARTAGADQARRMRRYAPMALPLCSEYLAALLDPQVADGLLPLLGASAVGVAGSEVIAARKVPADYFIPEALLLAAGSRSNEPLASIHGVSGRHHVEESHSRYPEDRRSEAEVYYPVNRLIHARTMHGTQLKETGVRGVPTSYYTWSGPVGQVFRAYNSDAKRAFAVFDLGAGTMACYGLPKQTADFYERDPALVRLCYDSDEYFTYIEDARRRGVNVGLVLGEARSILEGGKDARRLKPLGLRKGGREPEREYGPTVGPGFKYRLILVDSLGPDTAPGHFGTRITKEAITGYLNRLEEDGIILFHISSRYFDFHPVLANVADGLGLAGMHLSDDDESPPSKSRSHWVVLARKAEYLAKLPQTPRWTRDEAHLAPLGAALFPSGGSPALQAMAGLAHAGVALADIQAKKAHEDEGRTGNHRIVNTGWRALETTAELKRFAAEAPKEIKALEARFAALRKELSAAGGEARRGWLRDRLRALDSSRRELDDRAREAAVRIKRNTRAGVWADGKWDLIDLFER